MLDCFCLFPVNHIEQRQLYLFSYNFINLLTFSSPRIDEIFNKFLEIHDEWLLFLFDDRFLHHTITSIWSKNTSVELRSRVLRQRWGGTTTCMCFTEVICIGNCQVFQP